MIYIDEKTINPAQVVWVGDVREVKRSTPKVKEGDTKVELPPVYNFLLKVGLEGFKSSDYDSQKSAEEAHDDIVRQVPGMGDE